LADFKLGLGFEDVMVVLSNLPFHFHFPFRFSFFLDIFFQHYRQRVCKPSSWLTLAQLVLVPLVRWGGNGAQFLDYFLHQRK